MDFLISFVISLLIYNIFLLFSYSFSLSLINNKILHIRPILVTQGSLVHPSRRSPLVSRNERSERRVTREGRKRWERHEPFPRYVGSFAHQKIECLLVSFPAPAASLRLGSRLSTFLSPLTLRAAGRGEALRAR